MEEVLRKALTSLCKTEIPLFLLAFNHTIQSQLQSHYLKLQKHLKKFLRTKMN